MKRNKRPQKKIYMMLSKDKFRLPEATAVSAVELSRITGYSVAAILRSISRGREMQKEYRFIKVVVDDDE